ncbi:alpha/beta hydrolase [Priestia megaterium]|uniref:alpha/beta fold hydrolase n=1 Tax=Priestia megaterium TaxID=1404 RepID=UPI002E203D5F|nr:alpha/beta hydrolase [Priestia megaterium]
MKDAIIFLHGIVGNHSVFAKEMDVLKKDYYCTSYDFYPLKNVNLDDSFSLQVFVEQLYTHYIQMNIKKAHLCALSFGCLIALSFVQKYPHMVASLTFIGGYCCNVPSVYHTNLLQLMNRRRQLSYNEWLKECVRALNPNRKEILEDSEAIFLESARLLQPSLFERIVRINLGVNSEFVLREVNVPILWIMGEYDELYKGTLGNLKQYVPHVQYREIKRAGHVAHIHQHLQFMLIFKRFLRQQSLEKISLNPSF